MAVKLNPSNTSISISGQVVIKSAELINTLIADRDKALQFLSKELAPITLADLEVDAHGTVIVKNPAFKTAIEAKFSGVATLSNGTCGVAC